MKDTVVVNIKTGAKFDVYIGRPSIFGNPFSHKSGTLAQWKVDTIEEAVEKYEDYCLFNMSQSDEFYDAVKSLQGKVLGCFCKPGPCHGDILAKLADRID